jgi:hypothetical protein
LHPDAELAITGSVFVFRKRCRKRVARSLPFSIMLETNPVMEFRGGEFCERSQKPKEKRRKEQPVFTLASGGGRDFSFARYRHGNRCKQYETSV